MNAFSIFGRLTLDDREYQQGLKAAERETQTTTTRMAENWKKVGESLQNTGKNLSLYVTAPIVGIGTAFIAAASDAEETVSKFNTIFRDLRGEADQVADRFAEAFGLSSTNARRFLGDTSDLLTGFGFTAEAALALSEEVNGLAIDLASFTNFSGGAEGASQALTKALLGETESAKSLGIVITQELVQARIEELRANGQLLDATDAQAKAYATLQIAQEQSFNAIGDYARTTDSFANQTRRLGQQWNDVAVTFGTVLLPLATELVTGLGNVAQTVSNMDQGTVKLIVTVAAFAAALGPLIVTLGTLIRTYAQIAIVIPRVTATLVALRGALALLFVGPQAVIAIAIGAIAGLALAWQRDFGGMQAKTEEVLNRVRAAFGNLATAIGEVVTRIAAAWARLTNAMGEAWGRVSDYLGTAFAVAVNGILRGVEILVTGIDAIVRAGITIVERWNIVQELFRVILDGMYRIAFLTGELITGAFNIAVESIKAVFVGLALAVEKIFIGITNFAIKELNALIGRVSGFAARFGIELSEIQTINARTWAQVVDDSTEGLRVAQTQFEITQQGMAGTIRNTQFLVGEYMRALRQHMIDLGVPAEEANAIVGALGETVGESAGAFDALTTALVGPDGASGTTGAANDAAEAIGNLVNVSDVGVRVLINNAVYLRDLARAHLEAAAAASLASDDLQNMTEVSTSSADTVRDFVNVVPKVSVVLNDNATALGYVVDAHVRQEAAAAAAADAQHNANMVGLEASEITLAYNARAQELIDTQNMLKVSLGGSADAIADFADGATQGALRTLDWRNANVEVTQTLLRLGEATEDDVNAALVAQQQALLAVRDAFAPMSVEWINATNQLADLYDGLRDNESALLEQMARVQENTSEWTALEGQLERVRAVMALLGLDTGGAPAPLAAVDNAVQQGVQALRTYLDEAGGAVGRFGNLAVDVASKFPLVGAALDGFKIEIDSVTGAVTRSFDPMTALTSMFMDLLNQSESFRNLLEMVNERLAPLAERIIKPLVDVLTILIDALWPVIEVAINVVEMALQPFVWIWKNVLGPILTGVANAIRAVWNALARVIPGMRRIEEPREERQERFTGRPEYATSGPYVQVDESGRARISEGGVATVGLTAPAGSIARLRQQIQALQLLYQNTDDPAERRLAAMWIERFEARIKEAEVLGPGAAAEEERRRREQQQAERDRRDAEEERRRRAEEGQPPAPTPSPAPTPTAPPPPPPGTIAALEEERRALQAQLNVASAAEIPALNLRISELGEEINRLRRLGLDEPDSPVAEAIKDVLEPFSFGGTPQSVQLAVATPLVEASNRMLDAANVMNTVFGSMLPGQETGFGALPPFTSAIERMTPVLERLLEEGVSVMMGQAQSGPMASPTAFLRGV